jgi:HlyD family secretion protein
MADLAHMQTQVNVDETTLATLQVGQKATLTLDVLGGKSLTGHISKIAHVATTAAGVVNVPVTIDIDATDALIYPGLSAMVSFQKVAK